MALGIVVLRALSRIHALRVRLEQAYNELIASVYKGVSDWSAEQDKMQALEHEVEFLKGEIKKLSK